MKDFKKTFENLLDQYDNKFKTLELTVETKGSDTFAVYKAVDIYGIKNKSMFRVNDATTEDDIIKWVDKLVRYTLNVMKLNNWIDDLHSKFKVNYRFVISKNTLENSIVYAWDYNSVLIALSDDSLESLDKNIESLKDIAEYKGYESFADFVKKYLEKDYIKSLLGINFKENNIYYILEEHQLKKNDVIQKIHKLPKKSGILSVHSVLASSTFEILCRINWIINFDNVDINLSFDENQIFSTKDMAFTRDPSIIDGLLKLYKPAISDIFA